MSYSTVLWHTIQWPVLYYDYTMGTQSVLYCTMTTVQYSTVQYNMVQYSLVWYSTVQYSTASYGAV